MLVNSTKNYYEKWAKEYFDQTYSVNFRPVWQKLNRQLNLKAFILDLGCGSGRDTRHFANAGFKVVGLDYASSLLKLAKDFSQQPVVLANLVFPPFRNHSFDAVWAIGSLLHVRRQSVPFVLAQIHRILKAEAILLTSVKKGYGENTDTLGRYNVFYQTHEWKNILEENKFDVTEIEEIIEFRETKQGHNEAITWITCLARAV